MVLDEAPTPERSAPLFGRHETAELVVRGLQETAQASEGRILLLVGVGGVGKTTLLRSIVGSARGLGYAVVEGRSLPSEVPRPFGLLQELLRAAQAESRERDSALGGSVSLFAAAYDRDLHHGDAPGEGGREADEADRLLMHLASPAERVDADRSSFYAQLTQFFLQLASHRPLLLAVDDLQFCDDSSLEFLRKLAPYLQGARLAVVGTLTPADQAPPRAAPALEELSAAPGVARHAIRAMTEGELAQYVRWILHGRDPGRDSVMRWYTQTEGNPLFTEYLVRSSTGFGAPALARGADLDELLRQRVAALPAASHRVLVYAAVLGKEFRFEELESSAAEEEEQLVEQVDGLVHAGLLREKGGEVYEWVSERVRADVYAQLTETRRRLLHRSVARALLQRWGVTDTNLFELARQCYLGRDDLTAVDLNRRAAEAAARAYAFDTAAVHLERALECQRRLVPRDVPAEIRLLIELGRFLDELGDLHRSEEVLTDAVARARADPRLESELALALLGLAQSEGDLSAYARSRTLSEEAYEILVRRSQPRGLLAAHRTLGVACWRLGELGAAVEHQRAALALAESIGTPTERGHALIDLANTFILMGPTRLAEAAVLYEQAASIFAQTADQAARARVLMNRALLHHYAGELDRALVVVREALKAAEQSRSPIWIGYCAINLAQLLVELGRAGEATEAITRADGLLRPLGDHLAIQQITMIQAMIQERLGHLDAATAKYEESLALAQQLQLNAEKVEVQYRLANVAFQRGDRASAAALLTEARAHGIDTLRSDLAPRARELQQRLAAADPQS